MPSTTTAAAATAMIVPAPRLFEGAGVCVVGAPVPICSVPMLPALCIKAGFGPVRSAVGYGVTGMMPGGVIAPGPGVIAGDDPVGPVAKLGIGMSPVE